MQCTKVNKFNFSFLTNQKEFPKINSFAGLKIIAVFLIVIWHGGVPQTHGIDLGARMCELFFVISGFLVAYNFLKNLKSNNNSISSTKYLYKKIIKMWPLHIIMLILYICLNFDKVSNSFSIKTIYTFFLNFFLLQSWSPNIDIFFSFNGLSWFLSSMLFCYYLAPLFQKVIKSKKLSIILFFITFFIRYIIEFICVKYPGYFFNLSIHTSPIVRFLEFLMGMTLVPIFIDLKKNEIKTNKSYLFYTILEVVSLILIYVFMKKYNDIFLRATYILMFCFLVFIFAFDNGLISDILSLSVFQRMNNFQYEIYMSHNIVMRFWFLIYSSIFPSLIIPWQYNILIKFVLIILFSWFYHKFIDKHISKATDLFLSKTIKIFK